jgi:uncharacterized coiled-coil protein SlyX
MLEIEERTQLQKDILKTMRLLNIVTHPEKRRRLDKKLNGLFKRLQEIEKSKNELIKCDYGEEINKEKEDLS